MVDYAHVIFTLLAKPLDQILRNFGTKTALNDTYRAIESLRIWQMIFHSRIYLLNAKLAQVKPMVDCAHVIFTLLAKPLNQKSTNFGTFAPLNQTPRAIERLRLCQIKFS